MSATPSPSADGAPDAGERAIEEIGAGTGVVANAVAGSPPARPRRRFRFRRPRLIPRVLRRIWPKTLQGRLTLGFAGVVALSLLLVSVFVLYRLNDEFRVQQLSDLDAKTQLVAAYIDFFASDAAFPAPVVDASDVVNQDVVDALTDPQRIRFIANLLAESDVDVVIGLPGAGNGDAQPIVPAGNGVFHFAATEPNRPGLVKENLVGSVLLRPSINSRFNFVIAIRLSNPYTFRQTAVDNVTTVTAAVGVLALGIAVIVAAAMAIRVTTPLRRLTETSRALAEGDLSSRIPRADVRAGSLELAELATQFNAMADRLEESVAIIRRDRDRSRDFLADVSHELRTPIAALLTFNELLTEHAAEDPAARAEFLTRSRVQLERLDWLAQNLLELSKLDSGLVLLDLRPDDLRVAVESAVEQSRQTAERKGVHVELEVADSPIRIRHDPQRIGQVVTNLVGNAIKFTEPGGRVRVRVSPTDDGGGSIEVADTGVGIDPVELPRIFERFYRGSRSNEARASGSGLGLAIVRSIVDIHHGTVEVESRLGAGTRFRVLLPRDPRTEDEAPTATAEPGDTPVAEQQDLPKMVDSSPSGPSGLNREPSG
ncbi:MAG TPA: HAMP domain-containing sensor histidine kinase [Candidatus Limnocylindrales bacterium]|nr:HAMP domain-containing sensor histidine kinase [Candidatus Limnocylindrales bacterium]